MIVLCIMVWLGLAAAPPAARAAETVDRIVAVVNGEIITLFELNQRIKPVLDRFRGRDLGPEEKAAIMGLKKKALQQMIDDILLAQEVEHYQLDVSDVRVQNEIREFRRKSGLTEEQFKEQLKLEGTTEEEFLERTRHDILKHKLLSIMVRRKVVVTDEEIKDYYQKHRRDYVKDKAVELGLVILPQGMPALELKRRIEAGEMDFASAARQYSQGPGADQGGDIGSLPWGSLSPEWKDALDGVAVGGISEPLDIQGQEALLKLLSNTGGEVQPLDAVSEDIRSEIYRRKVEERFNEYMDDLRSKAVIDVRL